jgi:hypothetical protein
MAQSQKIQLASITIKRVAATRTIWVLGQTALPVVVSFPPEPQALGRQ